MSSLNKEQKKAAEFLNGIAAVIAVPGSGKTRSMMERIGILVKGHNVPPENILGLTFTRKCGGRDEAKTNPGIGRHGIPCYLNHHTQLLPLSAEKRREEYLRFSPGKIRLFSCEIS